MKPPKSRRAWNSTIAAPTNPLPSKSRKRILSDAELTTVGQTYLPTSALPLSRQVAVLKRATAPIRKARIKPKKRTPEQFERIYGPEDYQAFTRAQPCACCSWRLGLSQICHAKNGGKSRKADWTETYPGCGPHFVRREIVDSGAGVSVWMELVEGCNAEQERIGRRTFEKKIGHTLLELAAQHQAKWQSHLRETVKHRANWSRS